MQSQPTNGNGRPITLAETPEFKAAVASAVAEATTRITEMLASKAGEKPAETAANSDDEMWLRRFAVAAAATAHANQDPRDKSLSPEARAEREKATAELQKLLIEARVSGDTPIYRLTSKVVLPLENSGETLIEPLWRAGDNRVYPTEIGWDRAPNLAMEPCNEVATKIANAYRASIGNQPASEVIVDDQFAVTPGGKVVRGAPASLIRSREREQPAESRRPGGALIPAASGDHGAVIQRTPRYTDVRVLGSIAPPARQNG